MPIPQNIIDETLRTPHGETAYKIVETLQDAGFDTWWVGGGVRDMLLRNIPEDIDIATAAVPDEIVKVFPGSDATHSAVGAVLIEMNGVSFEVTTFREDDENSDGRHPEAVVFGTRKQDAARRDLTVNCLYWNPISSELYDPYEGEKDLSELLVRIIGEPGIRLKHAALRLLRTIRFRALLNGQYHPETYKALQEQSLLVETLSGTRRLQELEKILAGPNAQIALEDLWELDVLERMLPELHACKGIPQPKDYHLEGDVWEHSKKTATSCTAEHGPDVRLAALFHDCGKAETFSIKERIRFDEHASVSGDLTRKALSRLQCPAKRIDKIAWLIDHHMMMGSFADMNDERKAHWYFHPWFQELLQLFWLDVAGTDPQDFSFYNEILTDYNAFVDSHPRPPKPFLTGDEVMEILNIAPGSRVGEVLKTLNDAQVRKEVNSKEEAIQFVKNSQSLDYE